MKLNKMNRRLFLRNTSMAAAAVTLTGTHGLPEISVAKENKLPRWKGFNLLDLFSPTPPRNPGSNNTTEDDLKWMSDWGFDFVRIPMAYPRYLSFDRSRDITKDEMLNFDPKVLED
jgi:aryl-phospho-beta-D-glucosidase BglC (GH1 family)